MIRIYLYRIGPKVVIPRMTESEDGLFMESEPVEIFDLLNIPAWKKHIYRALYQGNDLVKTGDMESWTGRAVDRQQYRGNDLVKDKGAQGSPGSAILDKLMLERWSDFEKNAVMYVIHRAAKFITVYATGKNEEGMWTTGTKERRFHPRTPLEIVVDEVAADLMCEPEALAKAPKLLMSH